MLPGDAARRRRNFLEWIRVSRKSAGKAVLAESAGSADQSL
jgi:hypothetical protein